MKILVAIAPLLYLAGALPAWRLAAVTIVGLGYIVTGLRLPEMEDIRVGREVAHFARACPEQFERFLEELERRRKSRLGT